MTNPYIKTTDWQVQRVEDARRDIIAAIQGMSHDEWYDCLGDLEICAGWAHCTAHERDEAETRLCAALFEGMT